MAFNYAPDGCGLSTTIDSIGKVQGDIPNIKRPDLVILDIGKLGAQHVIPEEAKDLACMLTRMIRNVDYRFTP